MPTYKLIIKTDTDINAFINTNINYWPVGDLLLRDFTLFNFYKHVIHILNLQKRKLKLKTV